MCQDVINSKTTIDLLDRQDFTDNMILISKTLSSAKASVCYAVNGEWGVGKSFVINMFQHQVAMEHNELTDDLRFIIFDYNCWQYDYYEEPFMAIVASILDQIDEKAKLIPEDLKAKFKSGMKAVGEMLFKALSYKLRETTGIDSRPVADMLTAAGKNGADKISDNHSFDIYYSFKKVITKMRAELSDIAESYTILFIVDELDRCLPEYTIKVLERLHHIFEGIANIQVILSVDKKQLESVVKSIYGSTVSVERYLSKFINFELKLDVGNLNDKFNDKFSEYLDFFDYSEKISTEKDVIEFEKTILKGLDIRTGIQLISKCEFIHRIIAPLPKIDISYMCIEIFLAVLNYYDPDLNKSKSSYNEERPFLGLTASDFHRSFYDLGTIISSGKYIMRESAAGFIMRDYNDESRDIIISDIYGLIIAVFRNMIGFECDFWRANLDNSFPYSREKVLEISHKFWDLLTIIE